MIYRIDHEKLDEMLRKIARHYGKDHQLNKTIEELGELLAALSRYIATPSDKHYDQLVGELADAYNMLDQLMLLYGFTAAVGYTREKKVERQLQRIRLEMAQGKNK